MTLFILRRVLLCLSLILIGTGQSQAALEWVMQSEIDLPDAAIDIAESPEGDRLYVLTESGNIEVLNRGGEVEATLNGPFKADTLIVSSDGKRLLLTGQGSKTLQVVSLLDRYRIPVGQSPVKGDVAAAVSVVVFSDFQ